MTARLTWSAILSIVMIPLLAIGLLDPLEGLGALVIGVGLAVSVRLLSKVHIPKLAWISFVVAFALMALTIGFAIYESVTFVQPDQPVVDETVGNPMTRGVMIGGIPLMIVTMWAARLAELPLIAGLVVYTVRIFRARKAAKAQPASPASN